MTKKEELNYIKDCEINLEKDDLLSTNCYVETISEIIENSDTPFTIGLFGGWGSGKSSIIRTLKEKFKKNENSKAEVFVYDAWKYSNDSFRRTFILELKKQFNLDPTEEFESFYNDKNEEIKGKTGLSDKWWIYFIVVLLPILVINFIPKIEGKEFEWTTFIVSLFISGITLFISKTFVQYKISINKPKIFAPEVFENIFSEIIDKILDKKRSIWIYIKNIFGFTKKIEKLVIVIDNIDRCHKDLAFDLLLTIKNFLEKEGVIFIIPIDENETKKHLNKLGYDENEFLRKLFNTSLNIKKFSENDLYSFAKSLNSKHNLNLSENVISLVSQEFSKSPRRIIQFLNVLQTEILFSKKQEEVGNIPKGIISNNLTFLTKILLIREEWFEFYKKLRENPYILEDINQSLKTGTKIEFIEIGLDQLRFLERTRHIETKNIEAFFVNKDVFSNIPDELNKLIISQDWEEIKKVLDKNRITFEQLMEFINKRFDEDVIRRGLIDTTGFNILSLIFKISNDSKYSGNFTTYYYTDSNHLGNIKAKLNYDGIKKLISKFIPNDLFGFVKTNLNENSVLLGIIIMYIKNASMKDKDNYELFKEYIITFIDKPEYLEKVGNKYSEMIIENPDYFNDFENIFTNEEITKSLIKAKLIKEFINSLEVEKESNNTNIKVKIIKSFEKSNIFSTLLVEEFINKIVILVTPSTDYSELTFWFNALKGLILKSKRSDIHNNISAMLNNKYPLFANNYQAQYNINENYMLSLIEFLDTSKELYKGNIAENNNTILSWFTNFYSKNDEKSIYLYINKIYTELINYFSIWNWPFAQQIVDKFAQITIWEEKEVTADILNIMAKKTIKDQGLDIVKIKSIFTYYVKIFNEEKNKEEKIIEWIKLISKNDIVKEQLIENIKSFVCEEKLNIIKIIKNIDSKLLKESINEIVLNSVCESLQEILQKFNECKINKNMIENSVKNALNSLSKENDEKRFKCFLEFIVNNDLADEDITSTIINKIRPLLGSTNDEIIFSLGIISKLRDIDEKKKDMIKTMLGGLDDNDFSDDGKKLLLEVKSKL